MQYFLYLNQKTSLSSTEDVYDLSKFPVLMVYVSGFSNVI